MRCAWGLTVTKHSSLLQNEINDVRAKFYSADPCISSFFDVIYETYHDVILKRNEGKGKQKNDKFEFNGDMWIRHLCMDITPP